MRDLASGDPVPGVAFRWTQRGGPARELRSGDSGILEFSALDSATIELADDTWRAARFLPSELQDRPEIWVHRVVSVVVRLEFLSDHTSDDLAAAVVDVVPLGSAGDTPATIRAVPWGSDWLMDRVPTTRATRIDRSARFQLSVPLYRGVGARVRVRGWKTTWARVPRSSIDGNRELVLQVSRSVFLRGRLTSEDGEPIHGAQVISYVVHRVRAEDLNPAELRASSGATSARISQSEEIAVVKHKNSGWTDTEGAFSIPLQTEGETVLAVFAPGHVPKRIPLGDVVHSLDGLALAVQRASPAETVQFTWHGEPLVGHTIKIVLLSFGDVQPSPARIELDDEGAMPSHWFEAGELYLVHVRGPSLARPRQGLVDWVEQPVIAVDALSLADLDRRLRQVR